MSYLDKNGLQYLVNKIKNRIIPLDKGGTGATTLFDAKKNLGVPRVGIWQLSSNITLKNSSQDYTWDLQKSTGRFPSSLGSEYITMSDGVIFFSPDAVNVSRIIRVDISAYIHSKYTVNTLVTTKLWVYDDDSNSFSDVGIRWNTRPPIANPYVHMQGTAVLKIYRNQGIRITTQTSSAGGIIGSGVDTRVILTDYGAPIE